MGFNNFWWKCAESYHFAEEVIWTLSGAYLLHPTIFILICNTLYNYFLFGREVILLHTESRVASVSHSRLGVQKYYFPTKKKVNVLRSFDIITCNENCFKIAHIWWHQHMYAMEITYLLWELLLHCIPMVMSAMGITFF